MQRSSPGWSGRCIPLAVEQAPYSRRAICTISCPKLSSSGTGEAYCSAGISFATAMVKSPVIFQCFTSASLTVVWRKRGQRHATASLTGVSSSILPRDIIVGAHSHEEQLQENTVGSTNRPLPARGGAPAMATRSADRYFELKSQIHRKLIGVLNLERASSIPKDRIRAEIGRVVERLLDEERVPMTTAEQTKIVEEVLDEVLGLGPLETAAQRADASPISWSTATTKSSSSATASSPRRTVRFKDDAHLLHIIEKIVSQVGRRIDEAQPIVDARLPDGSRVNAIIPPLALDGPCLSIRRFGRHVITQEEMLQYKTITPGHAALPRRRACSARPPC